MAELIYDSTAAEALHMPLEGCHNFRAVAGWRTEDGATVRRGVLYRASGLDRLTDDDLDRLAELRIGHVFDLRAARERKSAVSRWHPGSATRFWSGAESAAEAELTTLMAAGAARADDFHAAMVRVYSRFPDDFPEAVNRAVHAVLADDTQSVLLHCTAGKDRTGFVTAMLLHGVGVREDDVLADYLLSNARFAAATAHFGADGRFAAMESAMPGAIELLVGVHPEYLLAATDRIRREHGSFAAWFAKKAGVDAGTLERLKSRLLD